MTQQCHSTRIKSVVFNYFILCSKIIVSSKSVTASVILWGYPPPTNSEIIICSFLWRAPYKPSLSTVSALGITPSYTHIRSIKFTFFNDYQLLPFVHWIDSPRGVVTLNVNASIISQQLTGLRWGAIRDSIADRLRGCQDLSGVYLPTKVISWPQKTRGNGHR